MRPDIEGIKLRALLMEGSHYANDIMDLLAYIEELEEAIESCAGLCKFREPAEEVAG